MVYHGEGFTFTELYQMPIHLRTYYMNKMIESRKKENDDIKTRRQPTPKK